MNMTYARLRKMKNRTVPRTIPPGKKPHSRPNEHPQRARRRRLNPERRSVAENRKAG